MSGFHGRGRGRDSGRAFNAGRNPPGRYIGRGGRNSGQSYGYHGIV